MYKEFKSDTIWCAVTSTDLNINDCSNWVRSTEAGAVVTFEGTTRNHFENKVVTTLSYECHEEMACSEMKTICEELMKEFSQIRKIVFHHKIAEVPVGEVSVICSISTVHRKEGFVACEKALQELKSRVPIWKKEIYNDQSSEWKENSEYILSHNL